MCAGRQRAVVEIATMPEGSLSLRFVGLTERAARDRDEVEANRELARRHARLDEITPP
jgi:hypothetical protein